MNLTDSVNLVIVIFCSVKMLMNELLMNTRLHLRLRTLTESRDTRGYQCGLSGGRGRDSPILTNVTLRKYPIVLFAWPVVD